MLNTIKQININSSLRVKNLDDEFDQVQEGLLEQEEDQFYNAAPELWLAGEILLEELYFLKEINYGMLQPRDKHYEKKNVFCNQLCNLRFELKRTIATHYIYIL